MKTLLRNKWIRALRSGKYRQIKYNLGNTGQGRCCLGVLCDIMSYKFIASIKREGDIYYNKETYSKIDKLIGVKSKVLSYKNDLGESFEKIAGWIKENL